MTTTFKPKQVIPIDAEVLKEFLGTATEEIAYDFLRPLVPFPAGAHIHDNGCGAGAVTEAILTLHSAEAASSLRISATDSNPGAIAGFRAQAQSKGWPVVETNQMDSRALSFPNDTFSHSFTSFVFLQVWKDDELCAREIYRTLKPGGIALVTTWEDLATMAVFRQAYRRLHGEGRELPEMLQTNWYSGDHVRKAMLAAGFDESDMGVNSYSTQVRIRDAKRWCEIGWSICGVPKGGWTQEDEDDWEEAVRLALEALLSGPWYQRDEKDENAGWLRVTASVIVGRK
ncbi:hypothetical protein F4677DRAFT_407475 [Hypoxylon crocopeplum]|nr:hypothetical protein F4677DRAFT_407475 [Hypoxylon crocopeplum]